MPDEVHAVLLAIQYVVNLGLPVIRVPLTCVSLGNYGSRLIFWIVCPAGVAVLILLVDITRVASASRRESRAAKGKRSLDWAALPEMAGPKLLKLMFLLYPTVSRTAFQYACGGYNLRPTSLALATLFCDRALAVNRAFACYDFSPDGKWLRADVSVECDSSDHWEIIVAAWFAVAIYPVGLLFVSSYLLLQARSAIRNYTPTRWSRAIEFLHHEFEPHCFLWEPFE